MKTFLILVINCAASFAFAQQFQIIPKADSSSGITMTIPYDLGTHHGVASRVSGIVNATQNFTQINGKLIVPLEFMATGNPTRDCHMREALGLDYTKSSFPKNHICDANNQLPQSGVDSIAFHTVEFNLVSVTGGGDLSSQLKPGASLKLTANGTWNIHGVQKNLSFPILVTVLPNGQLSLKASVPFALSDFGVVVKPVLGIGVKNNMSAELDILLAAK